MSEESPIETTESVVEDEREMASSSGRPSRSWFGAMERFVSILASLAIVAGIFFAIYQIRLSNAIERRRVAVEAIRQTRSAEFIKSFRQLKAANQTGRIDEKDKDALIDSLNYVMNIYDDIAVIYINDIADKCIVKDSVYSGANEMSAISDALSPSPPDNRKQFKLFLKLM